MALIMVTIKITRFCRALSEVAQVSRALAVATRLLTQCSEGSWLWPSQSSHITEGYTMFSSTTDVLSYLTLQ